MVNRLVSAALVGLTLAGSAAELPPIAPAPTMVTEGIPPIPAALAGEIRRYAEYRSAVLADWHPVRRELLIVTRFGNTPQIHHVKTPRGARTQLTFADEPITAASYEPTRGEYFIFARDTGGNEFQQLYRYDVQDGRITLLTDGGRSQNTQPTWSHRGDRIAYRSTRRNGTDRDVRIMNPQDPRSDRVLVEAAGGSWLPVDWSVDDTQLLVLQTISVTQVTVWMVEVATGRKVALTPPGEPVAYKYARFSHDGRGIYVTSDKGSEFLHLAYLETATKTLTRLTGDIPWDIENFELSPDGKTLAFVANEAGVSRLYLMDTATRRWRIVSAAPTGVMSSLLWHRSGADLGFSVASARAASDVYSLTVRTGEIVRWTESELGGVVADQLPEAQLIRWRSFDGREITGFYYRPGERFSGKRPVLVNIHGGPEDQFRPGFLGRSNYYVNELGVALIYPNVRGSSGYGKTFLALDDHLKREDAVRDIGAMLDWIATRPELDASRVMLTGASYGGYLTLASAIEYRDRIRSAIDVVGISNFRTFLANTESYRRDLRRVEYGDEREASTASFFDRISPLNNADRLTMPLFIVAGGNDPRVPLAESEQMLARVKKNGSTVWYLMARDEGHGFAKKSNVDFQFFAAALFVQQHLLAGEASTRPH